MTTLQHVDDTTTVVEDGMEPISLAERLLHAAWSLHFRIPELAYWALLCLGLWLSVIRMEASVGAPLLAVAVVGISRWEWDRWRSRHGLVVARFSTSPIHRGREEEAQRVILASLRDKLPSVAARLVHGVPVVVGPDDRDLALRLRRRLRAAFLLHGRIADREGRGWSVYARVMQPASASVLHADWHTRDVTPARVRWASLIDRLTPAIDVLDEEYPFEFTAELEAIVKGTAGQLALTLESYGQAERLLREAISNSPQSKSHQIDKLRADLARAVAAQGRHQEAMAILRSRARSDDASPELLRTVHRLIFTASTHREMTDEEEMEALQVLRKAADHQADPQRPMTLYNLAMMVFRPGDMGHEEAAEVLNELIASHSYYRHAWYVKRFRGLLAWTEFERLRAAGDNNGAKAAVKEAAKWYSRAIRARPKLKVVSIEGPRVILFRRYPRSVILHANAHDAHAHAGNRLRAWLHQTLAVKLRWRRFITGLKAFHAADWDAAYANLDWAVVGWGDDTELVARLYRCIALRQRGQEDRADAEWADLRSDARLRAFAEEIGRRHNLPRGLPSGS